MKETLNTISIVIGIVSGICTIIIFFYNPPFRTSSSNDSRDTVFSKVDTIKKATASTIPIKKASPKDSIITPKLNQNKKADFLTTFIKTPIVFYALLATLLGCLFVGLFQLFPNLFTKFEYGFDTTIHIWNWGWHDVTLTWYWNNGVSWHLALSITIWSVIVFIGSKD